MSEDAETYRGRAEQARLAAKATFDKQQRAIFEKLARSYQAMAENAELLEGNEPRSSEEEASHPV